MSRGREEIELDILFGSKEGKIGIQIEGNDINLQTICNIICFTRRLGFNGWIFFCSITVGIFLGKLTVRI